MIGLGTSHYGYELCHEREMFLFGFAPHKAKFSLYFATGDQQGAFLLKQRGKNKAGKKCVYTNTLYDLNDYVLRHLIHQSVSFLQTRSLIS